MRKTILFFCVFIFLFDLNSFGQTQSANQAVPVINNYAGLTQNLIGQDVIVYGKVISLQPAWSEKAPNTITLSDGSRTVPVVYWKDFEPKMRDEYKATGTQIVVKGKLTKFKESLQIKLSTTSQIALGFQNSQTMQNQTSGNTAQPAHEAAAQKLSIGMIGQKSVSQTVIIEGVVSKFQVSWKPTAPNKVTVADNSGSIIVVYWPDTAKAIGKFPLKGDKIKATGMVQIFNNELQIKVVSAANIAITSTGNQPEWNASQVKTYNTNAALPANTNQNASYNSAATSSQAVSPFIQASPNAAGNSSAYTQPANVKLQWFMNPTEGVDFAQKNNKKILVYFYANKVPGCAQIEEQTLSNAQVANIIGKFALIKVNALEYEDLSSNFNIFKTPTLILTDANGNIYWQQIGFCQPNALLPLQSY